MEENATICITLRINYFENCIISKKTRSLEIFTRRPNMLNDQIIRKQSFK